MKTALLFDIDGTLLRAPGLGRPAFSEAFEVAYGVPANFDSVSFVGATDTAVIREMANKLGIESTVAQEEHFYIELTHRLDPRLRQGPLLVYPGVRELLTLLTNAGYLLGIVTGNIRATAWGKLIHSGLADAFSFGAYSTDHPDRDELSKLAVRRAHALGADVRLLIGDTPKDVQAAHAASLPCLAVTTGWVDGVQLNAAGADQLIDGFSNTARAFTTIQGFCHD
ncbi:MAG: HAD family hydrolase [Kiritimatiellia bacterium]